MAKYHQFFHLFFQTSRHLTKKLNEQLSPLGIYSSQWTVIYYLKRNGPATQAELCAYLSVEAPTMTRTINRLELAGWVIKTAGRNKREKLIELTDLAIEQFPIWKAAVDSFESKIMNGITEIDQTNAEDILTLLNKNIHHEG